MNELELTIFEIIKNHRKKRKYLIQGTYDNPQYYPLESIWFSEIMKNLYPDFGPKVDIESKRRVKSSLLNLEKEKKIEVCMGEPLFYILYEDRDKLNLKK
ncbi:MAG: hypothetical protein WC799_12575 [Desulfobacteraceae bacterium]|jgi:hypothetical protein